MPHLRCSLQTRRGASFHRTLTAPEIASSRGVSGGFLVAGGVEAGFLLQQPTEGALDGEDAVGGVLRREAGGCAEFAQRRRVHAFQRGRDEMAAKHFIVRVPARGVAGAIEPFEDAQDEFLEPGAVKELIRRLRVLQGAGVFAGKGRVVDEGKALRGMALLRLRRAPGVGQKMVERFEQ